MNDDLLYPIFSKALDRLSIPSALLVTHTGLRLRDEPYSFGEMKKKQKGERCSISIRSLAMSCCYIFSSPTTSNPYQLCMKKKQKDKHDPSPPLLDKAIAVAIQALVAR